MTEPYHERQSRMQCAQHSINSLLQSHAFTSADLDSIAIAIGGQLSLQHRWPLLGNHDINVVMHALASRHLQADWWDVRKGMDDLFKKIQERRSDMLGLIVNVEWRSLLTLYLLPSRHYYALRPTDAPGTWLDLNSHHDEPAILMDGQLRDKLQEELQKQDAQIFVVNRIATCE